MPDGRPALNEDEELARERAHLLAMLQEGLDDIEAGRIVSMEEMERMIDEAFASQDAESAAKR